MSTSGFLLLVIAGMLSDICLGNNFRFGLGVRDNNLLICYVPSNDGRIVEENRFRLSFQPAGPGQVWQPQPSG